MDHGITELVKFCRLPNRDLVWDEIIKIENLYGDMILDKDFVESKIKEYDSGIEKDAWDTIYALIVKVENLCK